MISVLLFKMGKHSDFHLSVFQIVGAWRDFTVVTKLMKNFKSLRRNPPDVGVTSGQKPCTKIIYIALQTFVGLF